MKTPLSCKSRLAFNQPSYTTKQFIASKLLTPTKLLSALGALTGGLMIMTLSTTPAQAAGHYYNCANANGCKLIQTKHWTSNHTQTKYPIVMAHGLGGWTSLFGSLDYFYGIPQTLMRGGSEVYATKTSSLNDSEVRGEQLLQQVKTISAITGTPKVNLFGHSHGGHDIRYVAAVEPSYVASVTAVASPHQGSAMADWVIDQVVTGSAEDGFPEGEFNPASKAVIGFFDLVGNIMDIGSGIPIDQLQDQDGWAAIQSFSGERLENFNAKYPAAMPSSYCGQPVDTSVNGIDYYSFSGVGQITNITDVTDYIFAGTAVPFKGDPNDGLVSSCSSRLGYVIRDNYKMNHLDVVNQLFGMVAWGETNPKTVYRSHVNRLKNKDM